MAETTGKVIGIDLGDTVDVAHLNTKNINDTYVVQADIYALPFKEGLFDYIYSIGVAILDIDNPSKILHNCENYILTPEEPYETTGFVPNVCFPCATLHDADTGRIAVFYGAADTHSALAFTQVDELITYIKANPDKPIQ